jgi:tRNA wybutosine-synthesizing protein 4
MLATGSNSGILVGGLDRNLRICHQTVNWTVSIGSINEQDLRYGDRSRWGTLFASLVNHAKIHKEGRRGRVGASLVKSRIGPLLVGGVSSKPIPYDMEVLNLCKNHSDTPMPIFALQSSSRPLLVGASAIDLDEDNIIITGGGALCFSFGACLNTSWYQLFFRDPEKSSPKPIEVRRSTSVPLKAANPMAMEIDEVWEMVPKWCIHELEARNLIDLPMLVSDKVEPCVLRGMEFGACVEKWDLEYLKSKIGATTRLSIHKGSGRNLQFTLRRIS